MSEREKVIKRGNAEVSYLQSKMNDNRTFDAEREYLCQRTSISKHIVVCLGLALGEDNGKNLDN